MQQLQQFSFDSLTEMTRFALTPGKGNHAGSVQFADERLEEVSQGLESLSIRTFFGGFTSAAEIATLPANPPAEVMDAVDKARQALADKITPPKRRHRKLKRRLADGDELDPQAWLERDPEGWQTIKRIARESRTARIAVNLACASAERRENLRWRGATAAAVADLLTVAGVSVEIVGLFCSRDISMDLQHTCFAVTIKPADAPLDLGAVAVALAEVAFYRLVCLNTEARTSRTQVNLSMGVPAEVPAEIESQYDLVLDRGLINQDSAKKFTGKAMESWK